MTLHKLLAGFNLSLLLIFLLNIMLPAALLGNDVYAYFQNNITGIGIMLLSFIAINVYFAQNWSLFCFLERGDWYSLLHLLQNRVFERKLYTKKYIFYFIEVAIQLDNLELLRELFEELQAKSALLDRLPYSLRASRSQPSGQFFHIFQMLHWNRENRRNYRLAICARKRLCEYAIEFGLPDLVDDPGHDSEVYFGNLREFASFREPRYTHKYRWAELFYAMALFGQEKWAYAAQLLEQLLLSGSGENGFGKRNVWWRKIKSRRWRDDALLRLLSLQLLEELQENFPENPQENSQGNSQENSPGKSEQKEALFKVDSQLLDLCRREIQQVYDSPKHWTSCLQREQSQNIAIVVIRQLIRSAYEKQLRPAHQAYLAELGARRRVVKHEQNQHAGN